MKACLCHFNIWTCLTKGLLLVETILLLFKRVFSIKPMSMADEEVFCLVAKETDS
jgi:hypothetical protein